MLLLRLSGSLSLRYVARALSWLLFQDPPRSTRRTSQAAPPARGWRVQYRISGRVLQVVYVGPLKNRRALRARQRTEIQRASAQSGSDQLIKGWGRHTPLENR